MKLIQIATGAAVISTPLWAMAFMQGDHDDAWFSNTATVASGLLDDWVSFADFNQDGFADAIDFEMVFGDTELQIRTFRGNGDGTWLELSPIIIEVGATIGSWDAHLIDVNGDHYPDIVIENMHGKNWTHFVILNTGGTGFRCAGDVDGDGQTRVEDLVGLLEDWGCDDSVQ